MRHFELKIKLKQACLFVRKWIFHRPLLWISVSWQGEEVVTQQRTVSVYINTIHSTEYMNTIIPSHPHYVLAATVAVLPHSIVYMLPQSQHNTRSLSLSIPRPCIDISNMIVFAVSLQTLSSIKHTIKQLRYISAVEESTVKVLALVRYC